VVDHLELDAAVEFDSFPRGANERRSLAVGLVKPLDCRITVERRKRAVGEPRVGFRAGGVRVPDGDASGFAVAAELVGAGRSAGQSRFADQNVFEFDALTGIEADGFGRPRTEIRNVPEAVIVANYLGNALCEVVVLGRREVESRFVCVSLRRATGSPTDDGYPLDPEGVLEVVGVLEPAADSGRVVGGRRPVESECHVGFVVRPHRRRTEGVGQRCGF
jgi:hypothetical protein